MKGNVGNLDQVVRIILGIGILSLFFITQNPLKGLSLIGFIPIFTAVVRWCPIYKLFGISSCSIVDSK